MFSSFQKLLETIQKISLAWRFFFSVVVLCLVSFLWLVFVPPFSFPIGKMIEIPKGATLSESADILQNDNVISSAFLFHVYLKLFKSGSAILAGDYLLDEKQSLFGIAERVTSGDFRVPRAKVLITEGQNVSDIAKILETDMPSFDSEKFIALAKKNEGYLFPDTYFFFYSSTPEEIISIMRDNFNEKIQPLQEKISASGHSLAESITMASIVEREAVTPKDRRIIAGILWKRISLGMPLQVDATFSSINGKGSANLTAGDLKIDSLYNTYVYKGLPPGPISNPGLDTILATLEPVDSPYLYYLSDKNGVMHYAKTFAEHVKNKQRYLK